jgi:hypothetical protein
VGDVVHSVAVGTHVVTADVFVFESDLAAEFSGGEIVLA